MNRVYPRTDVYRCDGCAEIYDDYDFCPTCEWLCMNCCEGHMPICSQCGAEVSHLHDEVKELCKDCWAPSCPNCGSHRTELNAHMILKCLTCLIDWEADLPAGKWIGRWNERVRVTSTNYPIVRWMEDDVKEFMLRTYGAWDAFKKSQEAIGRITQQHKASKTMPQQEEQIQMQHSHEISKIKEETERSLEVIEAMKERREVLNEARRGKAVEAVKQAVEAGEFTNMKGEQVTIPASYNLSQTIKYVSNNFGSSMLPSGYESEKERLENTLTWLETLSGEQVELTDDDYDYRVGSRVQKRKTYEVWLEKNPLPSDE